VGFKAAVQKTADQMFAFSDEQAMPVQQLALLDLAKQRDSGIVDGADGYGVHEKKYGIQLKRTRKNPWIKTDCNGNWLLFSKRIN